MYVSDAHGMAFERCRAAFLSLVPELPVRVKGARRKPIAQSMNIDSAYFGAMTCSCSTLLGFFHVKKLYCAVPGAGQDTLLHFVIANSCDGTRVSLKTIHHSRPAYGPNIHERVIPASDKQCSSVPADVHAISFPYVRINRL